MAWYLVKQVFPPCSVQEAIFGLLHFHVNFRIGLSVSYAHKKKPVRILIRIVLNLWISLERTDFFMILRLLIYDWNTSPYIWDLQCLTINYNMLHVSLGEGSGNPLQCSCLENPRDGGSLVGCRLWGHTGVTHDWRNSAAAAAAVCIDFNLSMPHHLSRLVALSLFSMSVSLFLFHKWVCLYNWLNSIYKQYHIYISPSDWLSMIISRSTHVA